jgi:hypothetical protein
VILVAIDNYGNRRLDSGCSCGSILSGRSARDSGTNIRLTLQKTLKVGSLFLGKRRRRRNGFGDPGSDYGIISFDPSVGRSRGRLFAGDTIQEPDRDCQHKNTDDDA